MNEQHPARRQRHGQRPTQPLTGWPEDFGADSARAAEAAQPASTDEHSRFGSPELQARILANLSRPAATSGEAPDLQQLKALALAATPGPWHVTKYCSVMDEGMDTLVVSSDSSHEDRAYIAAASPAVVLDLIARIECLQEDLDLEREHLRQAIESIAKLRATVSAATKPTADQKDAMREAWQVLMDAGIVPGLAPMSLADGIRSLLATKPAAAAVPEGWMLVPKQFVTEVRRAAEIADSYSPSIDSIDEHGGEECEEPIWQIHHILYYAHAKLFGSRAAAPAAPLSADAAQEQARNDALEEAARECDMRAGNWLSYKRESDMVERGNAAKILAQGIRALKRPAAGTEGAA